MATLLTMSPALLQPCLARLITCEEASRERSYPLFYNAKEAFIFGYMYELSSLYSPSYRRGARTAEL